MPRSKPAPPPHRTDDEEAILRLLDELHGLPEEVGAARRKLENQLIALVDRHFREALKPFLLHKFGAAASQGGAARYTAMINDFFVKMLAKRPDQFWRAKSARELRKFASVVVSNQMRDYLRREARQQDCYDAIAPLLAERQSFFKQKVGLDLTAPVLDEIEQMCKSSHADERLSGLALRHRFVDGMTREQIADQLNVRVHAVRVAIEKGVAALRRMAT
jgi:DNA-directed RNA polymerase specialized sigma24 family protein